MATLPTYRVLLLSNSEVPSFFVTTALTKILHFDHKLSYEITNEAHLNGHAFLLDTHKEKAEFIVEQLKDFNPVCVPAIFYRIPGFGI